MDRIHLTDDEVQGAERRWRRYHDEALGPDNLGAEIDYWLRQHALLLADLEENDDITLHNGVQYAKLRLAELTRQAENHARAIKIPGYPPFRPREDLTPRFAAARYVDLVGLIETLTGQSAIKSGSGRYRIACPWHEDTNPSLTIYEPGKGWYCFSCHKGGDAVSLVAQLKTIPAVEALALVEVLADTRPECWERAS